MRYGSVCSGIEVATVALAPLGWQAQWYAEIDSFCCAVLKYRYPTVPNLRDFTRLGKEVSCAPIDLLIAGTPCQSFSVAGQRAGLADPRGNLTLEYFALLGRLRPTWMVWENVPGLLSDDGGRTFGACLGLLGQLGYGFAYRVLDAQYFGVPQRRERVFLVAYLGDWRPPAAVLFERHSLQGHPAPRRETGEDVAACLTQGVDSQGKGGYAGRRREDDVNLVAFDPTQLTSPGNYSHPQPGDPCHPLASQAHPPCLVYSTSGQGYWREDAPTLRARAQESHEHLVVPDIAPCLTQNYGKQVDNSDTARGPCVVAFTERTRADGRNLEWQDDLAYCLTNPGSGGRPHSKLIQDVTAQLRRLTPREAERLQGLPDDYTQVPYRGKPAKDGPRYRAIGNAFAVPVVHWIGERLHRVDMLLKEQLCPS